MFFLAFLSLVSAQNNTENELQSAAAPFSLEDFARGRKKRKNKRRQSGLIKFEHKYGNKS